MSDKVFCYHCRSYHPSEEVRLIQTRSGKRWRCEKSIRAGRTAVELRDAFGASVRETNRQRELELAQAGRATPHCVRELLRASGDLVEARA